MAEPVSSEKIIIIIKISNIPPIFIYSFDKYIFTSFSLSCEIGSLWEIIFVILAQYSSHPACIFAKYLYVSTYMYVQVFEKKIFLVGRPRRIS